MSLLAPLYFFGALAIGLPILFHLIRRRPRGEVEFSSLMFLKPSPPRLTRRSRLDNWFLLLIRALALILLAAAFARPFLRSVETTDAEDAGRSVMLLVDKSASMQRVGLWQQALDTANDVIAELKDSDQVAIVAFDRKPTTLLGFEQSSRINAESRKASAQDVLRQSAPSWHRTDIGRAVSYAAELAVSHEPDGESEPGDDGTETISKTVGPVEIILISDMQEGSRIESLQAFEWPDSVTLDVRRVAPQEKTNARATILTSDAESADGDQRVRIRVANSADADDGLFRVAWDTGDGLTSELPIQVPPGESRVVRMPKPTPGVRALVLLGDDHSFDNNHYLVPPRPEPLSLLHIGSLTAKPRDSLLYYLQRVPLSDSYRDVSVETSSPDEVTAAPDPKKIPLVVVGEPVSSETEAALREYVSAGGRVLVVLAGQETSTVLVNNCNAIAGSQLQVAEASIGDYAMLSRIRFSHPLFASMADPQYNDFSKIKFWAHRQLSNLEGENSDTRWTTVASFDDGDPALLESEIGEGKLWVLAAGWQPSASQLALSTKFIPLVFSFFDSGQDDLRAEGMTVGDPVVFAPSETASITGPSGAAIEYRSSEDSDGVDQPGIYQFDDGDRSRTFAINLDMSESRTEPMTDDALEKFGVALGDRQSMEQAEDMERQLRDQELEHRQKIWQWLLVTALGLLAVETWLGKRAESRTTS